MKFNVQKSSNNAGLATPKRGNVILALNKDVLKWPEISVDGTTYESNFAFVPGATFGQLYMTASTQAATSEPGGNPDGMGTKNKFVGDHPGTEREIMAFVKKYANEGFIVFYGGCGTDKRYKVMGSQCHPMKLSPSTKDDKDGNITSLTFEQENLNDDGVMFYDGDITFALPFTPAGESFPLEKAKGVQYQMPASQTAAEIEITSSDYENGAIISFLGGGGASPLVLKNTTAGAVNVLLKSASDWNALLDSVIHLKVVVADKTYLVETVRS